MSFSEKTESGAVEKLRGRKTLGTGFVFLAESGPVGLLKKPGGRKKQGQARGRTPRSQSLFFTAFAPLMQLIGFFNTPQSPVFRSLANV